MLEIILKTSFNPYNPLKVRPTNGGIQCPSVSHDPLLRPLLPEASMTTHCTLNSSQGPGRSLGGGVFRSEVASRIADPFDGVRHPRTETINTLKFGAGLLCCRISGAWMIIKNRSQAWATSKLGDTIASNLVGIFSVQVHQNCFT